MIDAKRLAGAIAAYQSLRPHYEQLATTLRSQLDHIAYRLGVFPIIQSRVKSLESFAEKVTRPGRSYPDPLVDITDLCGVRVMVHTQDQVGRMASAIEREFDLDRVNCEDKAEKLACAEFGYLSNHYIVRITGTDASKELKAELQLRTLAQHVWADVYHELGYKNEFRLPQHWEREFARVAAMLESCDETFQEIKDSMASYGSSYGAFMRQDELADLAERLEILLAVDPSILGARHRLVRTYLALEGGEGRIHDVVSQGGAAFLRHRPALRDIGVAYCQISDPDSSEFADGQALLRAAVEADPRNVDALCSLAGSYKKQGRRQDAANLYRRAHYLDPTDPYPLGNFISQELLLHGDPSITGYFRALVEQADERCRRQCEVGINAPWAWFDRGLFQIFLGDVHASLGFYAKGIDTASRAWMVRSAVREIEAFIARSLELPGLEILARLLHLGWWIRASKKERQGAPWVPPGGSHPSFEPPLLILSGGCGGLGQERRADLSRLGENLEDFEGTLIGGGTRSGVAGLVGDLQEQAGSRHLTTIGYVPAHQTEAERDERYIRLRETEAAEFSPLEPLTFWSDYLAAGRDPREVRVLGFNGGHIAACEFRIALAFGARVGIVAESGRSADELFRDPAWRDHDGLKALPLESRELRDFIAGAPGLVP